MKTNWSTRFNRKIFNKIVMVLLILAIVCSSFVVSFGDDRDTKLVTVGYAELPGFLYQDNNGDYNGLAYELLQEIGVYNNWEYKFVECGYSQSKKYLEDGTIDFFIPYQKTPEREAIFEYSNQVFCTNKATLLTSMDSDIYYDDFKNMDNLTIGVSRGTRNGQRFKEYLAEQGCNVKLVNTYLDITQMEKDLKTGEIDAFISASNRGVSDCKIIASLPETKSYAIGKKNDRSFLDDVDEALLQINTDMPTFMDSLYEKYQVPEEGAYPALTREEADYIAEKKEVKVLVGSQECDSKGKFIGTAKNFFERISKMTKIKFVPYVEKDATKIFDDFSDGKVDIIFTFNSDYNWAQEHNGWITATYATFYNMMVARKDVSNIKTVAVVPGTYIEYYVKSKLDYKTVKCKSYQDGINMVLNGQADGLFCSSPIGNYYSTLTKYKDLSFLSSYDFKSSYCMAVSKHSEGILVDILNKSIKCIPDSEIAKSFEIQMSTRGISMSELYYSHPFLCIGGFALFVVIIFTILFLAFYNRKEKQKNKQLALANSAKTDFLSRMSHDMRTPMNGILGLTELSKDESDINVIKNNLEQIQLSGGYLLNLINDTLDMNKIESGKLELHLRTINSEEVFSNIIANAHIMAEEKGVYLNLVLPQIGHGHWVAVKSDPSRLEQILINVISNAIKFTPKGGTVELHMETISVDDEKVVDKYIITDTGIGMSEEFLHHIFEAFSQEGRINTTREEGTGLGMPIVKQLVDLMGGTIEIESELGIGTKVTLVMVYETATDIVDVSDVNSEKVDLSVLDGKTALLCEDHPINAQIAMKLLEKKNINVIWEKDGEKGLERFEKADENTFDIIMMDIRMPKLDGIETTKEIRKLDKGKNIPIIAMTANAFDEDVENCLEAGMNAHIAKPIDSKKLFETMAKLLG